MILLDTSICIDLFRGNLTPTRSSEVIDLTKARQIAITPLVWVELYQGVRGKREDDELSRFLTLVKVLEFDQACWNETARISRICKRRGVNAPLSDIQIQACANRYGIGILHQDRHFDLIQEALSP